MRRRRLLLLTYGTRGDVEPFIALAVAARAGGQDAVVAGPQRFREFVEEFGVRFHPLPDTSLAAIESPDGRVMLEGGAIREAVHSALLRANALELAARLRNDDGVTVALAVIEDLVES